MKIFINFIKFYQFITTFILLKVSIFLFFCIVNCFLHIESLQNCTVRTESTTFDNFVSDSWQSSTYTSKEILSDYNDSCFHLNINRDYNNLTHHQKMIFVHSSDRNDENDTDYQWFIFEFKQHIQIDAVELIPRTGYKDRANNVEIWVSHKKITVDDPSEHCNATFMSTFKSNNKTWTYCGITNVSSTSKYTVNCSQTVSFTKTLLIRKFIQNEEHTNKCLNLWNIKLHGTICHEYNVTGMEMFNQTKDPIKKLNFFDDDKVANEITTSEFLKLFNSTLTEVVSDLRNKTISEMQTAMQNVIDVIEKLDNRKKYTNDHSSATVLLESVGKIGSVLYQTDSDNDITVTSSNKTINIIAGQMTKSDKQFVAEDKVTLIKVNTPKGSTNSSLVFTTVNMTNVMATLFSNLTDPTAKLSSNLIQATIYNRGDGKKISTGSTSTKIIMRLPFTASSNDSFSLRKCVFFLDEKTKSFESVEGCRAIPELCTSCTTVCECDHLTGFAVLMSPEQTWPDLEFKKMLKKHQMSLNIVTYVCLGISILCLLMTNITYFVVKLKFQLQSKNNMHRVHHSLCFMLMIAHILYLTGLERTENVIVCKVMSALIFYFYLSIFFWLFCEGMMYTKSLIIVLPKVDSVIAKFKFVHYCIIGYLGPLVVLVITIAIRHEHLIRFKTDIKDGNNDSTPLTTMENEKDNPVNWLCGPSNITTNITITQPPATCWLSSEKGTIWAFIGPVFLICLFNLVVFGSIIVKLSRRNSALTQIKHENKDFTDFLKRQLKLSFTLAIILGLTWLIGLFFAFSIPSPIAHLVMLYAFAIFNGLQGAFIFFTQVFTHQRIRDGWSQFLLKHKKCLPESLRAYLERRHLHRHGGSSSNSHKPKKLSAQPGSRSRSGRIPSFINFFRRQFSSSRQRTKTSDLLPDSQQLEQSESNKRLLSEHEHQGTFSDASDAFSMELKDRSTNIGTQESSSHSQTEPVVQRKNSNRLLPPLTTLPSRVLGSNDRINIA